MSKRHDDKKVWHDVKMRADSYEHQAELLQKSCAEVTKLEAALNGARRHHYTCDDCWYSCPKSPEGCCDDDRRHGPCDCGADAHNARIDEALGIKNGPVTGR